MCRQNECIVAASLDDDVGTQTDNLLSEIPALPDEEKLRVPDAILTDLVRILTIA